MEDIVDCIDNRFISARGWIEHQINPLVWGISAVCFLVGNVLHILRFIGFVLIHEFDPPNLKDSVCSTPACSGLFRLKTGDDQDYNPYDPPLEKPQIKPI
jgi:hypothetical protein